MKPVDADSFPGLPPADAPRQRGAAAVASLLGSRIDRSLMRTVSYVVGKRLLPREVDVAMLRESIVAVLATGMADEPARLFDFIPPLEDPQATLSPRPRSRRHRAVRGGVVYRRKLASAHRPAAELPDDDAAVADPICIEHWVHEDRAAAGTVIILHGFAMGWPAVDAFALHADRWFRLGLDVALLTLPDHGARRAQGAVFSGQSFTVPHALRLAAAVRRAVHEIFELKAWLRRRSEAPVGVAGMSLGGYLAALCGGLSQDFDFVVPLVPPVCMGDLAWRVYRDTRQHRMAADDVLTEGNFRAAFRAHSPLAHPRRTAGERILIAAGAGDGIVPPAHPAALWEHWGRPRMVWLPGSHLAPVTSRALSAEIAAHLARLGVVG